MKGVCKYSPQAGRDESDRRSESLGDDWTPPLVSQWEENESAKSSNTLHFETLSWRCLETRSPPPRLGRTGTPYLEKPGHVLSSSVRNAPIIS